MGRTTKNPILQHKELRLGSEPYDFKLKIRRSSKGKKEVLFLTPTFKHPNLTLTSVNTISLSTELHFYLFISFSSYLFTMCASSFFLMML